MLDGKEGNSDETLNSLIQMNMMNQMSPSGTPQAAGGMNNMMSNPLFLASMLGDSSSDGSSSTGGLDMTSLMLMGGLGGQGGGLGDLGLMSLLGGSGSSTSTGSSSSDAGVFEPSADNLS